MKALLLSVAIGLAFLTQGFAWAEQKEATDVQANPGSKLRAVELKCPEDRAWRLKSGFLMLVGYPDWVLLDGSMIPGTKMADSFVEGTSSAPATDGVIRFQIPEELRKHTWAKLSVGMHYDLPGKRSADVWDAWFYPDYQLPPMLDRSKAVFSFQGKQGSLKPHITAGGQGLDEFAAGLNGVFTEAQLSLEGLSVPDRPTFAGFHLMSFKPVNSLDKELGGLPVFKEIPDASGHFAVGVGIDRAPAGRCLDDTYSATFVIGDDNARIAPDGTLTASMCVDVIPIEVLTREGLRDRFVDIWATSPFKHCSNTTLIMSSNVRASGAQPAKLYFQRGVPFELQVFASSSHQEADLLAWMIVPVERPEKIVIDLRRTCYAYTGFDSPRVQKDSNNRP